MDTALQALLSWQFVLLCLGLSAITHVFRLIVQFFILDNPKIPANRTSIFWRSVILPAFPFILGLIIGAFIKNGIYPDGIVVTAARMNLGLVAGLLSGLVYKVVTELIKSKMPSEVNQVMSPESDVHDPDLQKLAAEVSKTINKE